jgi:pyruvate/2-oxoglutarate dehydrogenase complex dihydrolipoamide acyltransferase (E2) component
MAIVEVKVPQLSESVAEATLLKWKKKPGEAVAMDEILIEIETDKVVMEVPAPAAGVLAELLVADGGTVTAEQLIARIDTEAVAGAKAPAAPAAAPVAALAATGGAMAGVAMPAAAKLMAETGAVFGGEHSGHFYFRDFWKADSGMLAALHAIAALGEASSTLSKLLKPYVRYFSSGEINSEVGDSQTSMAQVEAKFGKAAGVEVDYLDGLTVNGDSWWFNVRASNTEPLLRLNVEAKTQARMEKIRDEVLATIRG